MHCRNFNHVCWTVDEMPARLEWSSRFSILLRFLFNFRRLCNFGCNLLSRFLNNLYNFKRTCKINAKFTYWLILALESTPKNPNGLAREAVLMCSLDIYTVRQTRTSLIALVFISRKLHWNDYPKLPYSCWYLKHTHFPIHLWRDEASHFCLYLSDYLARENSTRKMVTNSSKYATKPMALENPKWKPSKPKAKKDKHNKQTGFCDLWPWIWTMFRTQTQKFAALLLMRRTISCIMCFVQTVNTHASYNLNLKLLTIAITQYTLAQIPSHSFSHSYRYRQHTQIRHSSRSENNELFACEPLHISSVNGKTVGSLGAV